MNIYAISDLHLSTVVIKPMDIFGKNWENHFDRIREDWEQKVKDDDIVLLPGDFSWAMRIEDAVPDFNLLASLKGKK
ncbi:MAG: serine/threonine protein phosphatase, partial [Clostridia bacterium]